MTRLPRFGDGQTIGLFGGSFDPPHDGHVLVSLAALKALRLDYIVWLVSPQNPLKTRQPEQMDKRLAACRQTARHRQIIVSDAESQLGTQYTIDTLRRLKAHYPRQNFIWLMGADSLAGLPGWKQWAALMEEVPVAVYPRPGHTLRAGQGLAAARFARQRWPAHRAARLKFAASPAWVMLEGAQSGTSSTALRRR